MPAPYFLAVDVGTSRTAAAIARSAPDGSLIATSLTLGRNADSAPTAVFVSEEGLLFGDAAERRGTARPENLVREFKRRVGDDVPIVVADRRFAAEELFALTVAWVVSNAVAREGQHPARIAVTVPVTWGEYRTQLVAQAIERQGWRDIEFLSEPEAAARHYESTHPLEAGRAIAVYDFGGGTFDAVILRKGADGAVEFAGAPVGISDLGGADFDDLVLRHTLRSAALAPDTLASAASDSGTRMALASLRRECIEAKESLSFDGEVVVPVLIGHQHGTVRLTRTEFEDMVESEIERTIELLDRAMDDAHVEADDLDAILLTGGTSRIPRVAQLLSERFERPIAIDADPKAIIALGASRAAASADERSRLGLTEEEDDAPEAATAPVALEKGTAKGAGKRKWGRPIRVAAVATGAGMALAAGIVANAASLAPQPEAAPRTSVNLAAVRAIAEDITPRESTVSPTPVFPVPTPGDDIAVPVVQQKAPTTDKPKAKSTTKSSIKPAAKAPRSSSPTPVSRANTSNASGSNAPAPRQANSSAPSSQPPAGPTNPAQPSNPPTETIDPPAQPSNPPAQPSNPPAQPSDPPAEPSNPPAQPSDPPAEPSNPPAEPTEPPVQPSEQPAPEPTGTLTPAT